MKVGPLNRHLSSETQQGIVIAPSPLGMILMVAGFHAAETSRRVLVELVSCTVHTKTKMLIDHRRGLDMVCADP